MNEIRNEYFPYNDLKRGEKLNEIKSKLKKFAEDFGCVVSVEYDALHNPYGVHVRIDDRYYYDIKLNQVENVENSVNTIIVDALRKIRRNTSVTTGKVGIKKVIFNNGATIVLWNDGGKTVAKCQEGDTFDPEKGLAMAISKRMFGNCGHYYEEFKKWVPVVSEEIVPENEKYCVDCKYSNVQATKKPCCICRQRTKWEPKE